MYILYEVIHFAHLGFWSTFQKPTIFMVNKVQGNEANFRVHAPVLSLCSTLGFVARKYSKFSQRNNMDHTFSFQDCTTVV